MKRLESRNHRVHRTENLQGLGRSACLNRTPRPNSFRIRRRLAMNRRKRRKRRTANLRSLCLLLFKLARSKGGGGDPDIDDSDLRPCRAPECAEGPVFPGCYPGLICGALSARARRLNRLAAESSKLRNPGMGGGCLGRGVEESCLAPTKCRPSPLNPRPSTLAPRPSDVGLLGNWGLAKLAAPPGGGYHLPC